MTMRYAVLAGAAVAAIMIGSPAQASPTPAGTIAYVRAGSIYVLSGPTETRITRDSDDTRPRWSPDGRRIAYGHAGKLWVMNPDGSGKRSLVSGTTGAAWSPDGRWLAFAATGCTGLDGVFRIPATGGAAQALFPAECRGQARPAPIAAPRPGGDLATRMRADSALAWSPDGTRIAFRGGSCLAVLDDCLTVGTVATGAEQLVDGYGGGGQTSSGFAVVPAWRPDGSRLSWTSALEGDSPESSAPVHVVEANPDGSARRTVGVALDREMTYGSAGTGILTGQNQGASWVIAVDLATGARTPLRQGSQPDVA